MSLFPSKYGTYSQRPAAGNQGKRWFSSDGVLENIDNGVNWQVVIPFGGTWGEPCPGNVSPFTFVTGVSTLTDTFISGGVLHAECFTTAGGAQNLQGYEVSKTTGQSVTAWFTTEFLGSVADIGIYVRDTVSGKLTTFFLESQGGNSLMGLVINHYNSLSSFNANVFVRNVLGASTVGGNTFQLAAMTRQAFRIRDNGSGTFEFKHSWDGFSWETLFTETTSSFVPSGGNRFGFMVSPFTQVIRGTLLSWDVASNVL